MNIEPFKNCIVVKDCGHDEDLCQASHIRYLSARQLRAIGNDDQTKLLGMSAFRFLVDFPEYVQITGEKIVFSGILLRNTTGSPHPYHPVITVKEKSYQRKKTRTVEIGYLLQMSMSSEFYYVAVL
ncbi:MAG TPA: hypothetical protein PKZ56_02590 [Candidatus Paceibacterota bacterium]|jgi:hypothetical protein|nr:hypothetical protein [Candidatus Paceibacterota bacterium]